MLDTVCAQLRTGASLSLGIPFSLRSLDRLIDALLDTRHEFGSIGSEASERVGGPKLDEEPRREMQLRRIRTQALRGAKETPYYNRQILHGIGMDPRQLSWEIIARIPVTSKEALRAEPDAFVRRGGRPAFRTITTGTTGRPTSVFFSDREMRAFVALSALGRTLTGNIGPEDIVQVNTSSRAILGNTCAIEALARLGEGARRKSTWPTTPYSTATWPLPRSRQRISTMLPDYLGSRGLAARLCWRDYPEPVPAFDAANPLMVVPGALTGSRAPYSGRTTTHAFSPQAWPYEWRSLRH